MWDAAGTHKRPRPKVAFFSRQGEKSDRSGITLPDTRGWSTQSDRRGAVTLSLREGRRRREAPRREEQCDRTVPHVTKTPSDTCTTRERACASDRHHTAQAAHAHVQPHVTPTWFQCASRVTVQHDTNKHINHVCVRAQPPRFLLSTTSPTGQPEVSLCRSADAGARHRAEKSSVTAQCPKSQKHRQTHAPHKSVHVPLTDSTPHRLRTRMCNRTSHPHGFTHSLTQCASCVTVQHDTNMHINHVRVHAQPCGFCTSGSLAHQRAFAAPSSFLRPYGAFVAPVFVGYHDDVAMLPVFLSQGFDFAGDGTAVV